MVLGFLYKRFKDKLQLEENKNTYEAIQEYLLDDVALGKAKKPILWIHIPYECNSRNWLSHGSRNSFELNQPYLFLTIRSIIQHCRDSFTICIFDDSSFKKLMPEWQVDLTKLADPILDNMRLLGMMKLLYSYGGLFCPLSFLCMQDLLRLYSNGTKNDKMFICETVEQTNTLSFCGAPKECKMVAELCNFIQSIVSHDHTAESAFLKTFDKWIARNIEENQINMISGAEIGTKTREDKLIIADDLMSNHYLDLYKNTYGILIPSKDLLSRLNYGWFVRSSPRQVIESNTIIGNYLFVSLGPETVQGILNSLEPNTNKTIKNKFVGFWRLPSDAPYYGLKPNYLGNNIEKIH